jgi:hypothetical protein
LYGQNIRLRPTWGAPRIHGELFTLGFEVAHRDALERLAAADLSNTQWQRDLSFSYESVGDVLGAQGTIERVGTITSRPILGGLHHLRRVLVDFAA